MKTSREKERLKNLNTAILCIGFSFILFFITIMICYFMINENTIEKPEKLEYDYHCYLPLEEGNYTINEGILHTPSGRNIKCEELTQKLKELETK